MRFKLTAKFFHVSFLSELRGEMCMEERNLCINTFQVEAKGRSSGKNVLKRFFSHMNIYISIYRLFYSLSLCVQTYSNCHARLEVVQKEQEKEKEKSSSKSIISFSYTRHVHAYTHIMSASGSIETTISSCLHITICMTIFRLNKFKFSPLQLLSTNFSLFLLKMMMSFSGGK